MFLGIDTGNTSTTIALFDDKPTPLKSFRLPTQQLNNKYKTLKLMQENFSSFTDRTLEGITASSVVPKINPAIQKIAQKLSTHCDFICDHTARSFTSLYAPCQLGADRICNAEAALHGYPKKNLLIADIGTATTLCVLTADKVFQGNRTRTGERQKGAARRHSPAFRLSTSQSSRTDTAIHQRGTDCRPILCHPHPNRRILPKTGKPF